MKHINKLLLLFFIVILLIGIIITITILNPYPEVKEEEHFYCGNAFYHPESAHATGQQLFRENCKSCHKLHEDVVGPALHGVTERRPKGWIYAFIQNSSDLINKKDTMAVNLFNKYNKAIMTSFPTLTNAEIDSILIYVEE